MPSSPVGKVIEQLRNTALWREDADALSDGQLLERFLDKRDDVAFAVLVQRHGPMVWGVCRRIVGDAHAAEDAFQATFLVLVRKAAVVKPRAALANWLYGVARHTALKARTASYRVRAREKQVTRMPEPAQDAWDDREKLQRLLDQELSALPDKYRLPVVLCDLEGRTRKEVAAQLKIPEGTLSSRLATAHQLLAKRLARRGLAVSGGSLAALFAQEALAASVPVAVVSSTVKTAALVAARHGAVAGVVSAKVAALAEGVMKAMLLTKLKSVIAVLLVLGVMATGATVLTYRLAAAQDHQPNLAEERVKAAQNHEKEPKPDEPTDARPKGDNKPAPPDARVVRPKPRYSVQLAKNHFYPGQCSFLTDNALLVRAGDANKLDIRDARTGKLLTTIPGEGLLAGKFKATPDGKWIAARTSPDPTGTFLPPRLAVEVTLWKAATWEEVGVIDSCRELLAIGPDGHKVAVLRHGQIEIWDVAAKKRLKVAPFAFDRIDAAALSPDGSLFVVSGLNEIAYWKWRDGNFERLEVGRLVASLAFSPDGKLLAEGPQPGSAIEVRDLGTMRVVKSLKDKLRTGDIQTMMFIHGGDVLLSASGGIDVWDVRQSKLIQQIGLDRGGSCSLAVSPDGKSLAVVSHVPEETSLIMLDLPARPNPKD